MSIDITHKEAETFIKIKSDLNKINNANLSLEINDVFMDCVDNYYKTNEVETLHVKHEYSNQEIEYDIQPINLFKLLCKHAHSYAEPGVLFMNRINNYNLNQFDSNYTIECTNPCGEQPLIKNGACLLSAINLSEYVKKPFTADVYFDYRELQKDIPVIYEEMNRVLDEGLEKHALKEQMEAAKNWRNIGIGITGLAEMFIKFMTPYGSSKSIQLAKDVMRFLFQQCLYENIKEGKEFGSFPMFSIDNDYGKTDIVCNSMRMFKVEALRNCSMLTVAPTGSISNLIGVSSMGIEPIFAFEYKRRTVSLNGEEKVYSVYPKIVNDYLNLHPEDSVSSLPYYFVSAYDIDWKTRIEVQAEVQKYVDSAISSTINVPSNFTLDETEQLYLHAWKAGLKGVTIYRDGSRDPILFTEETNKIAKNDAIKRPKVLKAKLYRSKAKGENYIVIVGLLNNQPYEIFAFKDVIGVDSEYEGEIIKVRKEHYDFVSGDFKIEHIESLTNDNGERSVTLLCSMLLRHNAPIEYIIKSAKKINPLISSFTSTVCRILSKYSKDEESVCPECGQKLIKSEGCQHCESCGYSRCNMLIKKRKLKKIQPEEGLFAF